MILSADSSILRHIGVLSVAKGLRYVYSPDMCIVMSTACSILPSHSIVLPVSQRESGDLSVNNA